MGLLTDLDAARRRPGPACAVARVLAAVDDTVRADLHAALAGHYTGEAISEVLRGPKYGFPVSAQTINRHRRGICSCP
jgi:hypothetical protein